MGGRSFGDTTREATARKFVVCSISLRSGREGSGRAGGWRARFTNMDRRRARTEWKYGGQRSLERWFTLRLDFDRAARPGLFAGSIRIRGRCGARLRRGSEIRHRLWLRAESLRAEMEFHQGSQGRSLLRARWGHFVYELLCTSRDFAGKFHVERRTGIALSAKQIQLERGAPLHAHFERLSRQSESWDKHAAIAHRLWTIHAPELACTLRERYDVARPAFLSFAVRGK